jgi:YggT family protein
VSPLFDFVASLISIYRWVVIGAAIYSTLASFGVLDTRNRVVWNIGDALYRATEPALRPIRNILPHFGSMDFSPIVLILLLSLIERELGLLKFVIITGDPSYLLQ